MDISIPLIRLSTTGSQEAEKIKRALKTGPLKWSAERTVDHIDNIYRHASETDSEVRFVATLVGNIVTRVLVTIDIKPSGNGFDKLTNHHEDFVFVARL